MNKLLFLATVLFSFLSMAQEKENISSHNKETIVTDPSKGANSYKRWTVFPKKEKEVRQIVLNLTFECPDGMRCADWDYVDHIIVRPKNDTTSYEIARMLTPYGGRFQDDWKFQWKVDLTDFSPILRDSVEVDYIHMGYEDNKTRGWKVTTDFEFTYGTPVAEVLAIHKIYDGNYSYGDKNDPIENHLTPVTIVPQENMVFSKVKVQQTGHGMDANGCGEFCDKYREIVFNGTVVDAKQLWTECGDNPLYPQAGTWIFDRANWCPGYLLQPDEVLIHPKKRDPFNVELNMEPYETEKPSAKELLVAYVIEYGKVTAQNDVALVEIVSPSTEDIHSRKNPTGGLAVIRLKNNGKNPLKTVQIKYSLEGEKEKKFLWKGNLPFGETALLSLPEAVFSPQKTANFTVELSRPNGKKDGFKGDNRKTSVYSRPHILPQDIILHFNSNKKANENYYSITNALGEVVFKRDSTALMPSTAYIDTLHLKKGSYTLRLDDTAGDGLEFWFKARAGRGSIKLLDTLGQALKHFKSDFGSSIIYNFAVVPGHAYDLDNEASIAMFPSRTPGPITVEYFSNTAATVQVSIVQQENEAVVLEEHIYHNFKKGSFTYDLSYLPKMRYYLKVVVDGKELFKNRIRLKE